VKYSAVPPYDGFIIEWFYDGEESPLDQYPRIWVERRKQILVDECTGSDFLEATLVSVTEAHSRLRFMPITPSILHRGKGGLDVSILGDEALKSYERFRQEIQERRKRGQSEFCEKSQRVDGKFHSWEFDGDDPWVVCCWCGERRRA